MNADHSFTEPTLVQFNDASRNFGSKSALGLKLVCFSYSSGIRFFGSATWACLQQVLPFAHHKSKDDQ
jgi:hypothetical protein